MQEKNSLASIYVYIHTYLKVQTHPPNEWVKCFSPKQRWLQYMGNTPTTFPFPPTVIFFLSACSLSLLYIPSSMLSYNNAVMTQIIHFTTPPLGSHFFQYVSLPLSLSPSDLSLCLHLFPNFLNLSACPSSFHPFSSPRLLLPLITRKCELNWALISIPFPLIQRQLPLCGHFLGCFDTLVAFECTVLLECTQTHMQAHTHTHTILWPV